VGSQELFDAPFALIGCPTLGVCEPDLRDQPYLAIHISDLAQYLCCRFQRFERLGMA
jgi:hypothetical protein